jgi:2-polyprenyl-3-methyl-5-hydroxy-6-metoxy-1,4-benzoquinol methylase
MESKFTQIYKKNIWGGSGSGSKGLTPDTTYYLNVLRDTIDSNHLKTICDLGCGDWDIYKGFDWSDCQYLGLDCVASVIENNTNQYGQDNIIFQQRDITKQHIIGYDLVILKDVIQHWDDADIVECLDKLVQNNKFVFITNGFKFLRDATRNDWFQRVLDKKYHYHPVDIHKEPMKRYIPLVVELKERRAKQMLLLKTNLKI